MANSKLETTIRLGNQITTCRKLIERTITKLLKLEGKQFLYQMEADEYINTFNSLETQLKKLQKNELALLDELSKTIGVK